MIVKGIVSAIYEDQKQLSVILPEYDNMTTQPLPIYGSPKMDEYKVNDFVAVLVFNNDFNDCMVLPYGVDNVQSDWNVTDTESDAFIKNKPDTELMTYYSNTDNTFETTLNEIWATMKNTSVRHIQFYDKLGLIDNKFLGTLWRYTVNYGVLEAVNYKGLKAIKCYYNGVWEPWEWVNPPMSDGVEYRTTKRYFGKPVYDMCIDIGALPNTSEKLIQIGQSGDTIGDILQIEMVIKNSEGRIYTYPFITTSAEIRTIIYKTEDSKSKRSLTLKTLSDLSGYNGKVFVEYTKQ